MAEPIATVKQGTLKGITDTDLNGETYYKFLGIPYAKPPVGPLRFKGPQPAESWTGIYDATKEGSPCLGLNFMTKLTEGSEDCLYLNVYTKALPKPELTLRPVLVFIHGGAFTMGSGSELMQGPKYLMAEDVVLVLINYRIGIFGFLSSDDISLEIPGNAGLKDQTFALKWVQDNISSFNGDPNNVTIFGVSAGGASVHFQVLSPTAKGLFHKAVAQSGVALNPWAWGQKNLIQVAEKLEQKVSSDKDALDVLMKAPTEELYQASLKIPDVLLDTTKRRPFGPVIEKPNPTAFLTKNPTDLLASGEFNQVPLIQGFTSNEGLIYEFMKRESPCVNPKEVGVYWGLGLNEGSEQHSKIKAAVNELYFKDGETDGAKYQVFGDVCFTIGIIEATKLAAKTSCSPVYLYVFSYEIALAKELGKAVGIQDGNFEGVSHGGDQLFLFDIQLGAYRGSQGMTEETKIAIKQVTKIWTDFARTGRPHEQWDPVTNENELKYFNIDKDPQLKVKPFAERVAVWEKILKELPIIDAHIQEHATL